MGASELADVFEPKLSRLTVTVTMAHAGLEVTRNGEPVAAIGTALPIDPGTHTIAAQAPGYEIWSTTISVGESAQQETVTVPALTPKPEQADSGPAVGSDGAGPAWQTVAGVVALGVGVVGLGVGITFGVLAAEGESDLSDPSLCPDKVCKPGEGTDALATVETQATVATVGVVVGSLAVIGGTVLLLLSPNAEQGDALLLPVLGPGSAGLVFSTRF